MDILYFGAAVLLGISLGVLITYIFLSHFQREQRKEYIRQAAALHLQKEQVLKKDERIEHLQDRMLEMNGNIQRLEAEKNMLMQEQSRQETAMKKWEEELKMQFEFLAQNILEKKSGVLTDVHQTQLEHILQPMREQLSAFQLRIERTYDKDNRERIQLQKEIEMLMSLNQQLSEDAQNLALALKGDNKIQGSWGEMVLTRILESSGLRNQMEYKQQVHLSGENGQRLQPDVVVYLPGDKHLIIDSKVSLKAYAEILERQKNEDCTDLIDQHTTSITRHIKNLASKYYHMSGQLNTPEFVFMFLPIEPAFSLALQHKPDLFTIAWDKKIILVSPSSLLATLKTVSSVWQIEYQNQNALKIARLGGALYDKFAGFVEEMDNVEKHLERAVRTHQLALSKMRDGQGNLILQAERLKKLGVKTQKSLNL